jgi:hypothetical protein
MSVKFEFVRELLSVCAVSIYLYVFSCVVVCLYVRAVSV